MTYQDVKISIKRFVESNGLLNLLMKLSPILIFLRPVSYLLQRLLSYGGFLTLLVNLDAIFTILFVVGLFLSFVNDKGFAIIGALVLYEIHLFIWLFGQGRFAFTLNPVIFILLYLALLVLAVVQTSRRGDFAKAGAGFRDFMAPREQVAMVNCPVCGTANSVGVNFCTNCGSAMPQQPQPPVQPQAPTQPTQQTPQPMQPPAQPTPPPAAQPVAKPEPTPAEETPIAPATPATPVAPEAAEETNDN